jgi:GT2 family glycosyltransferase/glycosyltransferase involved in cell wall biosynthesis
METTTPGEERSETKGCFGKGEHSAMKAQMGRTPPRQPARDREFLARVALQAQVDRLTDERALLARELSRAYKQPLRPLRHALHYRFAKLVKAASARVFPRFLDGFARSAQSHSPKRFDKFLRDPGPAAASLWKFGPILTAEDARSLTSADVENVSLPVSNSPLVSIIIPTYGKAWLTLQCLKSIAIHPPSLPFEVIVADNASGDLDVELLRGVKGIRLENNPTNLHFLRSCNRAANFAKGEYLFFLNNDTVLCEYWLEPLLAVFEQFSDAGLVGSKLLFPDGSLQEAGGIIWNDGSCWNYGRSDDPEKPEYNYVRPADYLSGCAILVPRTLWRKLGGFDELYAPGYCEDSDLAFRIRAAGRRTYYCPFSVVVHLEGATHGTNLKSGVKGNQITNSIKLFERWRETLTLEHLAPNSELMRARDRSRGGEIALVVDHYVPEPDQDAGSRTIMAMIVALLESGYVVKFWPDNAKYSAEYTPLLQRIGVETIYGTYYSFEDWIQANGKAIALALLSRPSVAPRYIPALRAHSKATIAYYGHDLHFRRMGMEAKATVDAKRAAEAAAMEAQERTIWRQVDVVLYPSEEEAVIARSEAARAAAIIPYVYDEFGEVRSPPRNHEIMFVAGFGHSPNEDAAVWLVEDIFPRILERVPDARLAMVGSNPTETVRALASEWVEVTGRVSEEELRERYARARLALVPVRTGAGVKSKVVEALRDGLPTVTTSVGVQGLHGAEMTISIADEAPFLSDAAVKLLLDDVLWAETSARQLNYARGRFSRENFRRSFFLAIECSTEAGAIRN